MKKKLLFVTVFLASLSSFGQSTYSMVIHEQNYAGIQANGTYRNDNGELIFSGNFDNGFSHVTKIDSLGNPIWTKTFEKSDQNNFTDQFIQKDQIIKLLDSNYLLTRNLIDWSNGKTLSYLIKFSESGDLIWSKRTHKNDASNSWSSFSIEMDNGKILHALSPDATSKLDILRLDSNGIIENQTNLDIDNSAEPVAFVKNGLMSYLILKRSNFSCLIVTIDTNGAIIESSKFNDFIPADGTIYNNNLFLIGQNSNGLQLTAKIDFISDSVHILNIPFSLLSRIKVINNEIYTFTNDFSHGSIIKIDFNNSSTEEFNYSGSPINMYLVDSTRFLSIYNGPSFGIKQYGEPQVGLLLFDTLLLNNSFCFQAANYSSNLFTYSEILTNDTLVVNNSIASIAESITVSWQNGNLIVGLGCVDYLGGIDENDVEKGIVLVPNPSNSYFSIHSDETINASIDIIGFDGKTVKTTFLGGTSSNIPCDEFQNGIYVVKIRLDNGVIINKKLVIAH